MKHNLLLLVIFFVIFSCNESNVSNDIRQDYSQSFPLPVPVENSQLTRWAQKKVLDSLLIDDMEGNVNWELRSGRNIAAISYTSDRYKDGTQSLRFRTSLRDTAHLMRPENRTQWGSFGGEQGGGSRFGITFDEPQDWSEFNRISIWVYIHPSANPMFHFFLELLNEGTPPNTLYPRKDNVVQDLDAGRWHQVLWEIPQYKRDKVKYFNIFHTAIGYNPEGEDIITYDFDRLQLQRVDTDHYEGWDVPDGNFAFSHVGYRPKDLKIALIGAAEHKKFEVVDQNNKVAFKGVVDAIENKNGKFNQLDFSKLQREGIYRLRCGASVSDPFPINREVWLNPLFSGVNFYFCQRCGFDVPGIHGVCHEDWQGFHGDEVVVINGGWHDAGDMSQGYFRTGIGTYVLLRNLELVRHDESLSHLAEKMEDEAAWGLRWLLKNRFSDGYHVSWARMRIYTDNIIGTIDDVMIPARNIPWENFLGAATEGKAAMLLKDKNPKLAEEARKYAQVDWQSAIDSREEWDEVTYMEAAWGAIASVQLFKMTGDAKYKEYAIKLGNLLVQCQEQSFQEGIPVTGYFYTSPARRRIVQNNHGSNDEVSMLALKELCNAFPEHENFIQWYSSVVLHGDFFLKQGSKISAPYYLVPNGVFRKADFLTNRNDDRINYGLIQYNHGTALNDNYAIRTFPIWNNELFHGGTSTHLSTTWALAEASLLRNDTEGMQLVSKQLEWTFGNNPFGQTLMYGVGYNFAPQFAYCTKNLVGSLPVGMDCMRDDVPHWHGSNYATSKEMWIDPVNKIMGVFAAYTENYFQTEKTASDIKIEVEKSRQNNSAIITIIGTGNHSIDIKTFNATTNISNKSISLTNKKPETINLDISIPDRSKPYVIVITVDGKSEVRKEIVGTFGNLKSLALENIVK